MKKHIRIKLEDFWVGGMTYDYLMFADMFSDRYDVEIREDNNVDYLLYSVYKDKHLYYPDDVIKICYSGEDVTPDFNLCDYALAFDWMEYGDRYFRLPYNFFHKGVVKTTLLMEKKHEGIDDSAKYINRDFCSFTVSNGWGDPIRERFFKLLSEYKHVDSGGKWMNNVGGPIPDKLEFDKKHKFSICFENSSHSGYTTEKIVDGFAAQTIPIYWGDPDVGRVYNKKAFICVNDFDSLEDVIAEVKRLDNDDEAYMEMLRQPALINDDWRYENVRERLRHFLFNIFDQPLEKAQRHTRIMWQAEYLDKRRIGSAYYYGRKKYILKKILRKLNPFHTTKE